MAFINNNYTTFGNVFFNSKFPIRNPAVELIDWEGTVLMEYSAEELTTMTAFNNPNSFPRYYDVDHEYLSFQSWNWSISDIITWVSQNPNKKLTVGAIYTTSDGQDHTVVACPRLYGVQSDATIISKTADGNYSVFTKSYFYRLRALNIPNVNTGISENCFVDDNSISTINLPSGITTISANAFSGCSSLEKISMPKGITTIGVSAFNNCIALKKIVLPDSLTRISNSMFNGCYSLNDVTIPSGIAGIDYNAFQSCKSLANIKIPSSVRSLGTGAFRYCISLPAIDIPASVTAIQSNCFTGASILCDVVVRGKPSLGAANVFDNTHSFLRIYVPRDYLSWYETASNWSTLYAAEKIVAMEDYEDYLASIGINV